MPEYTEVVVQATTSRRAFAVHLSLPRGLPAGRQIVFEEEEVTVVGGKASKQVSGSVSAPLVPADTFPIINVLTGVPTGANSTHQALLVLLMSLYADLSTKRDAAAPPP